jgi:hypothetical protein
MYIFGYGSLINKHTRENQSAKDVPARVRGYRRDWNARISDHKTTALGLEIAAESFCNGVLLETSPGLLDELDRREQAVGYTREKIEYEKIELLVPANLSGTEIYTYIPINPLIPTPEYPILRTYIDTVLFGCLEHGEDFLKDFIQTTKSWDYPILEDRERPEYPRWNAKYMHAEIDAIFMECMSGQRS